MRVFMFEFPREFIFELPVPVFEFLFDTLTVAIGDGLGVNVEILVFRVFALFALFVLVVVPPHPSRLPSTKTPSPVPAIFLINYVLSKNLFQPIDGPLGSGSCRRSTPLLKKSARLA